MSTSRPSSSSSSPPSSPPGAWSASPGPRGGAALPLAWLALIALLALSEARGWDLPTFTLTVLSLPATVWGSLSRPVRGRPVFGFALGLLNYLTFPISDLGDLIRCLLHGCVGPIPPPPPGEVLLGVTFFIALVASYALGAALVASWGENLTGGERAVYGFALAFASWFLTIVGYFFTG